MLFGTEAPKFINDPAGTPEEVLLDYSVVIKDEPEEDRIVHQSIFTGHREFILRGKYWIFEIKVHLFKYDDPIGKYNEIKQFEGMNVRLYRHQDGDYIKQPDGSEASFFIESIDESYYQTADYKDLLFIRFVSNNYVDLSKEFI